MAESAALLVTAVLREQSRRQWVPPGRNGPSARHRLPRHTTAARRRQVFLMQGFIDQRAAVAVLTRSGFEQR